MVATVNVVLYLSCAPQWIYQVSNSEYEYRRGVNGFHG